MTPPPNEHRPGKPNSNSFTVARGHLLYIDSFKLGNFRGLQIRVSESPLSEPVSTSFDSDYASDECSECAISGLCPS
jgi:hypothetical protein